MRRGAEVCKQHDEEEEEEEGEGAEDMRESLATGKILLDRLISLNMDG